MQNLSFRATYNNFLVIELGKNYLIIGIRQGKHFKITGRIYTPGFDSSNDRFGGFQGPLEGPWGDWLG